MKYSQHYMTYNKIKSLADVSGKQTNILCINKKSLTYKKKVSNLHPQSLLCSIYSSSYHQTISLLSFVTLQILLPSGSMKHLHQIACLYSHPLQWTSLSLEVINSSKSSSILGSGKAILQLSSFFLLTSRLIIFSIKYSNTALNPLGYNSNMYKPINAQLSCDLKCKKAGQHLALLNPLTFNSTPSSNSWW